jgi:hypothetical protein
MKVIFDSYVFSEGVKLLNDNGSNLLNENYMTASEYHKKVDAEQAEKSKKKIKYGKSNSTECGASCGSSCAK